MSFEIRNVIFMGMDGAKNTVLIRQDPFNAYVYSICM